MRSFLNQCGKKLLLFVDNANEILSEEVPWLNSLSCRLILTSRTRIDGIPNYEVRFLPPEVILSVYQQNSGDKSQESVPLIEEIIQRAAYHTQTVVLLARTQANSGLPAQAFLEKLNEKGFALDGVRERVKVVYADGKGGANPLLPHCVSVEKTLHDTLTNSLAAFLDRIASIIQETGAYARALTYFQDAVNAREKTAAYRQKLNPT